jgi:hypothetical protein
MAIMEEGIWPCTVLGGNFGTIGDDNGPPQVVVNVQIDEGPNKGRRCSYEEKVDAKSALYAGRSCKAVGWRGGSLTTLKADIEAWITKTGGKTTVEVKHITNKTGKRVGEVWAKVNALGRVAKILAAPSAERLKDADEAMRRAMADDGAAAARPDDDAPPPNDDDIPF